VCLLEPGLQPGEFVVVGRRSLLDVGEAVRVVAGLFGTPSQSSFGVDVGAQLAGGGQCLVQLLLGAPGRLLESFDACCQFPALGSEFVVLLGDVFGVVEQRGDDHRDVRAEQPHVGMFLVDPLHDIGESLQRLERVGGVIGRCDECRRGVLVRHCTSLTGLLTLATGTASGHPRR
jgi:hypothetical protein